MFTFLILTGIKWDDIVVVNLTDRSVGFWVNFGRRVLFPGLLIGKEIDR